MALPTQFLDQVRERTTLSALIGRKVKLDRAGREFKACCPFHGEKTPSFTVNDDKGFYHCFGCGAHGDVFRWMEQMEGLTFIEAVKELALAAGMDMPEQSPEQAARAERIETVRGALDAAQAIFARQLAPAGAVMEYLAGRGIDAAAIERFGIGYARGQDGSLRGSGIGQAVGQEAGLLVPRTDGAGLKETFWDRVTVPIHDARGRLCGFGARVWPGRRGDTPKFLNSPDGPLFDKGSLLFNHHRAAELLRAARPAMPPLVVVEGYFDVVAMDAAGFAAVAPMGTALTERQLEKAWQMHHRPVLLLDGDKAGQAAAMRACRTALPLVGPGRELRVAVLPAGADPDDVLRAGDSNGGGGAREIEACLTEARPLFTFVFDALLAESGGECGPEATAALWHELSELAATIRDDETRAQYLGQWRARFDREVSSLPQVQPAERIFAIQRSDDGDYVFPESADDSEAKLFAIVRRLLHLRRERKAITEDIAEVGKFATLIGFNKKELAAVVREIESDLENGPEVREEAEMVRVLYRRALGIRGPMNEAMMPQIVDARPKAASAAVKRREKVTALIGTGAVV